MWHVTAPEGVSKKGAPKRALQGAAGPPCMSTLLLCPVLLRANPRPATYCVLVCLHHNLLLVL